MRRLREEMKFWEQVLESYNKLFPILFCAFLGFLVVRGLLLHQKKDENSGYYRIAIKNEVEKVIVQFLIATVIMWMLNRVFSIDISYYINIGKYWKLIAGVCVAFRTKSGIELFRRLQRLRERRRIKDGEYKYLPPEKILTHEIEWWDAQYELQGKRMDILKGLSPISILPLIAGYILEGTELIVDWKWCIGGYALGMAVYAYSLWKCYNDMREAKWKKSECRQDLLEVEYENEKTQDTKIKVKESE